MIGMHSPHKKFPIANLVLLSEFLIRINEIDFVKKNHVEKLE